MKENQTVQEKINITRIEAEKRLFSDEGLLGFRIVKNGSMFEVQEYRGEKWIVSLNKQLKERVSKHKRFALRSVFKELRNRGSFTDDCEMMQPYEYSSETVKKFHEDRRNVAMQNARIGKPQNTLEVEPSLRNIEVAAKKYEKSTQSVHMQFDATIARILDFWIDEDQVILSAVDANVPLERIQFHPTYRSETLHVYKDAPRIEELLQKVSQL